VGSLNKKYFSEFSDLKLIQRYQDHGDMEAIGDLFKRYTPQVFGLCLKYFKNTQDSEDAVMSIFELITKKLKKHDVQYFKSWLYTLSKNYCLEQLRKANRTLTKESEAKFMYSDQVYHPDSINQDVKLAKLKKCMHKLPDLQRECTELFYYKKHSYAEIALELKLSWSAVRSYIQNGRRNLKICIEKK
jgi:RNA polymerase sigma-70 factor (ECF subfamily)